jgi:DNA-binding protein H-NS
VIAPRPIWPPFDCGGTGLKRKELEDVVSRIKEAIQIYGITAKDLGLNGSQVGRNNRSHKAPSAAKGGKAHPGVKFRDEGGNTWGGRGPRPRWLREALASGKQLHDFAV